MQKRLTVKIKDITEVSVLSKTEIEIKGTDFSAIFMCKDAEKAAELLKKYMESGEVDELELLPALY